MKKTNAKKAYQIQSAEKCKMETKTELPRFHFLKYEIQPNGFVIGDFTQEHYPSKPVHGNAKSQIYHFDSLSHLREGICHFSPRVYETSLDYLEILRTI